MPSANQNLTVITGVIGLLWLMRSRSILHSIFEAAKPPPLLTLSQIIVFSFCGLLLNCISRAEREVVITNNHDSSKQQHITVNTPSK
ncbi:MP2 [Adonis mosaic virus]|uniref:MP2 n=1 Tax=Adonis mosaic virus TaxID=1883104 RepID=A0A1J1DNU6_9TOMB|nr:MP2 [Adonis mosaic virus]BAV91505.1 MP2 [Adonis mosaic virus]